MNIANQIMNYAWYLIGAAVIVFPWYIISKTFEGLPNRQAKALSKATKLGHVCTAHLSKKKYVTYEKTKNPYLNYAYICTYTYQYKDKIYNKKLKYGINDIILDEVKLYFIHNPKTASLPNSIVTSKTSWPLRYIIVLAIILLIKFLLVK